MTDDNTTITFVSDATELAKAGALGASTSLIEYEAGNQVLIIGETDAALAASEALGGLSVTVVEPTDDLAAVPPVKQLTDDGIAVYRCHGISVSGYLGAFEVTAMQNDQERINLAELRHLDNGRFDLILDLLPQPTLNLRLPPFGYFPANSDEKLAAALAQLPEMTGVFEKPRYFNYEQKICAHSRSNLQGCQQCLEVCVTGAISSQGEGVAVDPFLCQGCGSCATVCPSGAMTYAYPRPATAIEKTRELINAQAQSPRVLVLYSENTENESALLSAIDAGSVLPLAVDEVTAYGIDYWAAILCTGISRILLLHESSIDDPNHQALVNQVGLLHRILQPLGFGDVVQVVDSADQVADLISAGLENLPTLLAEPLPAFTTHNDKRQTFRTSIDMLLTRLEAGSAKASLPAGSPFGKIVVDTDNCTLCMACVSVCPAGALLDGQGQPQLRMIEAACVQCGMCETACPENVITRQAEYVYDSVVARKIKIINEEQPFNCVRCHKPFATHSMINTMTAKLADHWMFSDEKAMRRLKMCEDCRVIDMFEDDAKGMDVHRGRQ